MRINGWTCTIGEGDVRTAKHPENGTAVFFKNARFIGHADCPVEVMRWILRPILREQWDAGHAAGYHQAAYDDGVYYGQPDAELPANNPWDGEPPNKDKDVS